MSRSKPSRSPISPADVESFLEELFGDDLHAKRVRSLADGTTGVLRSASLGVHGIGRGLATARGLADKHAVKQVDRLLSNAGIEVEPMFASWVPHVVGDAAEVRVNMDWTEFDRDDQSMLVLSLQTERGRSTPLVWRTWVKSSMSGRRNDREDEVLVLFRDALPPGVRVTIVADRGFGDHKLYEFLGELGFDYIIRFRGNILVKSATGEERFAKDWLGARGTARLLRGATLTREQYFVPTVVVVQDREMDDAWCLAASDPKASSAQLKKAYGKRFTIEEMFRDVKDWRFGLGMAWHRVGRPDRRDRLFLLAAFAQGLLTLLGLAGERAGLDRLLKTNTSKTRTISLFRQGLMWYERIPNMPDERLHELMRAFGSVIAENPVYVAVFSGK